MDAELMRALKPKITLEAAVRRLPNSLAAAAAAWLTLPLDVAAVFWSTWAEVYSAGGAK